MHTPSTTSDPHELPLRNELWRKALHLIALVVPLGMFIFGRELSLLVLIPLTFIAVSLDIARFYSERCAAIIRAIFGRMMRDDEWRSTIGFRLNGATWVLIAASLLALIFPIEIAAPAFATFMVADASAALVGRIFGKHKWPGTDRTLEGSLAFVLVAGPLLFIFPTITLVSAGITSALGAVAEAINLPLNDNVRAPMVMAFILWIVPALGY